MITAVTTDTLPAFEQLYFALRQKEGRIYTDAEVLELPAIHAGHPYYHEWEIRKQTQKALVNYIRQRKQFSNILEVGCGNGWLCARIAACTGADVTGADINQYELEQARRVFGSMPHLHFVNGTLDDGALQNKKFDMIIFAASIQYFPSLAQVTKNALEHLTLQGEIHIVDSHFYEPSAIPAARERSREYFKAAGFATMAEHYYHHQLTDFGNIQYKVLQQPNSWKNKLTGKKNPFHWIMVRNRYQ